MEDIIKSYSAILDHKKLSYDLTAVIEVTEVKGKVTDVENIYQDSAMSVRFMT